MVWQVTEGPAFRWTLSERWRTEDQLIAQKDRRIGRQSQV